jgi:hypothetical protein
MYTGLGKYDMIANQLRPYALAEGRLLTAESTRTDGLGQFDYGTALSVASGGVTTAVSLGLASTGVGAPVAAALEAGAMLLHLFSIGQGRNEADAIVPVQNGITERLGTIDKAIGHDAMGTTSIPLLQAVLSELVNTAHQFLAFLRDPRFVDGRASGQAANTMLPIIDGTGDYGLHAQGGHLVEVDAWGNPTNGGRVGAVQRRIRQLGGTLAYPQLTQGGGVPSLSIWLPGEHQIPQAGTLPPVSPYSSVKFQGIEEIGGGASGFPLMAGLGILAFLLLRR